MTQIWWTAHPFPHSTEKTSSRYLSRAKAKNSLIQMLKRKKVSFFRARKNTRKGVRVLVGRRFLGIGATFSFPLISSILFFSFLCYFFVTLWLQGDSINFFFVALWMQQVDFCEGFFYCFFGPFLKYRNFYGMFVDFWSRLWQGRSSCGNIFWKQSFGDL